MDWGVYAAWTLRGASVSRGGPVLDDAGLIAAEVHGSVSLRVLAGPFFAARENLQNAPCTRREARRRLSSGARGAGRLLR